jgi:DNA polymerase-1
MPAPQPGEQGAPPARRPIAFVIVSEAAPGRVRLIPLRDPLRDTPPPPSLDQQTLPDVSAGSRKGLESAPHPAPSATSYGGQGSAGADLGDAIDIAEADLPEAVARLERGRPRWVWRDTARWYPSLLAAGVRVERCVDLRLSHAILRHSALTRSSDLATSPPDDWDTAPRLDTLTPGPTPVTSHQATLFDVFDDALISSARFGATTARDSPHNSRISEGLGVGGSGSRGGVGGGSAIDSGSGGVGSGDSGGGSRAGGGGGVGSGGGGGHDGSGSGSGSGSSGSGAGGGERDRVPADAADRADQPSAPEPPELTEFRLQRAAVAGAADPSRIALLLAAESAGSLVAAEMQHAGLPWSAALHDELLTRMLGPRPAAPGTRPARLEELLASIRTLLDDPTANPDSPAELVKSLRRAGLTVSSTRSWELKEIDHPAIPPLLEYKKLARLLSANGWTWVDTWVREGRFHPNYIPGGVVTGRWASEGGGALQLPKQVRSAVVADPGWKLVVADAAQLEPRILAALAGDRAMAAAGRDRDLYDGIVASGAVDTRAHAKVGMLGAMYGGTTGESGRMLPRLARAYPVAIKFVEDAARAGEAGAVVTTRLGRTSPRPSDAWQDVQDAAGADGATEAARSRARSAARSWGRFTRNFVVQGTAAEWALCWIGAIRRRLWHLDADSDARLEQRPHLAFFLHDEVMVHTPASLADTVAAELRAAAVEAGRLIFGDAPVQFPVTVAVVDSYDQAK